MQRINVQQFKKMVGLYDCLIIDVRTSAEILTGMIDHAVHIDLQDLECKIEDTEYHKFQHIIFYCRSGYRSISACDIAENKWQGKKECYSLDGGILAWNASFKH